MSRLPEKFPEYSIMYKTLVKKIQELENENEPDFEKIKQYKEELLKIEKKFPEGFFDRKLVIRDDGHDCNHIVVSFQ